MFKYNEQSRLHWFNPNSFENTQEFRLIGNMFGLGALQGGGGLRIVSMATEIASLRVFVLIDFTRMPSRSHVLPKLFVPKSCTNRLYNEACFVRVLVRIPTSKSAQNCGKHTPRAGLAGICPPYLIGNMFGRVVLEIPPKCLFFVLPWTLIIRTREKKLVISPPSLPMAMPNGKPDPNVGGVTILATSPMAIDHVGAKKSSYQHGKPLGDTDVAVA